MHALSSIAVAAAKPTTPEARIGKAATDFEGMLLGTLLRSLEQTLGTLPGQEEGFDQKDYYYLGTQALAEELARGGGLGIGRSVARQLAHQSLTPSVLNCQGKVLAQTADLEGGGSFDGCH